MHIHCLQNIDQEIDIGEDTVYDLSGSHLFAALQDGLIKKWEPAVVWNS